IKTSLNLFFNFYHNTFMHFCVFSYFLIYIIGAIFVLFKSFNENRKKCWMLLAIYISGIGVITLCALSLTIFLKNPDIEPRVLLGTFGFMLSAPLFLISISRKPIVQLLAVSLCVVQIIPTLSLSFAFGNYLRQELAHDTDAVRELEFHLSHYTTNAQTKITLLNDNFPTLAMNVNKTIHPLISNFMSTQGFGRKYGWYSKGFLNFNNINYEFDNSYYIDNSFVPDVKTCHIFTSFVNNHIVVLFRPYC
ncbi:MAG: hypothetical protein ABF791_11450, partial [Acetobacter sp.]|uniref:hypothetical protein n=1 Tax=Acetobacter sp. TaxID=440 RepID=UPI0039E83F5D